MKNSKPNRVFPFSYKLFKEIYSQVPRICVDLVIQDQEGRFVLLKRQVKDSNFGQWHFPGGTVYFREPIEKAVLRIAKDETGLDVAIEGLVGFLEYLEEVRDGQDFHSISLAVVCSPQQSLEKTSNLYQIFSSIPENMVPEQEKFLAGFLKGSWQDEECHDPDCKDCDKDDCPKE